MRIAPLVLSLLIATPLGAQIRMPKPRIPNPLNRATEAAGGPRAPEYDDRVVEINDARITGLLRGLKLEQDQRPVLERGYRKNADDRAAVQVASRRQADQINAAQTCLVTSPEYRAIYGDTAAQRKTAERISAARDRGDESRAQAIEDSITQAMMNMDPRVAMGMVQAQQRCAASAPLPTAAARATPTPAAPPRIPLADSLRILGAGAAGMTPEQYTVMQERVLGYLVTDEAQTARGQGWAFSAGEVRVLHARRAALQPYQQFLADH